MQTLKESEIRPNDLFQTYIELSQVDGTKLDPSDFYDTPCQGCQSTNTHPHIIKNKFSYKKCSNCGSLFCSPRPNTTQLNWLYTDSPSSKYWATIFFPNVESIRKEKLFKPKAEKIIDMLKDHQLNPSTICEVGAGHGLFLEEIRSQLPLNHYSAIEPNPEMAETCKLKGFNTIQQPVEIVKNILFDFVICSEVIEHVSNVKNFIDSIYSILNKKGACLITGLGYEGFDILTLQEKSNSLSPPHHLNFLSISGFETIFKQAGFNKISILTPGQLDVDIVLNSSFSNEWIETLKKRGPKTIKAFQDFLVENKLSSHVWILAQR